MTDRIPKHMRRNLNPDEVSSMGFTDMQEASDEDGWPYPDDDDEETTERYRMPDGRLHHE